MRQMFRLADLDLPPILTSVDVGRMADVDVGALINEAISDPNPAQMFMRMFFLLQMLGERDLALDMQGKALALQPTYRIAAPPLPEIRLLALMGPGGMMDNIPLEFVIPDSAIRLDLLFLTASGVWPETIPEHDVAIVALSESDSNRSLLDAMESAFPVWPRPILNRPAHIMRCARDAISTLLSGIAGLCVPATHRILPGESGGIGFPSTIRPVGSHAGKDFAKIDAADALAAYFDVTPATAYYVSEFIDYRSQDGLFRKYRIALIDGKPYLCHLAISDHWMVHYQSAEMANSPAKRAEEAVVMESFATGFAQRHAQAFQTIYRKLGLDYVVLDCGEMPDGRLLVFEADIAGWIHATDPVEIYPYKPQCMQKAFAAFKNLLLKAIQTGKE